MKRFIRLVGIVICIVVLGYGAAALGLGGWEIAAIYAAILVALRIFFRANFWAMRGNLYHITGRTDMARLLLKKATDARVKSPRPYLNYAILLLSQDRDCAAALPLLEQARELSRDIMDEKSIELTIATCHWLNGQIPRAIETLEAMRKKYDYLNPSALTTLGYLYLLAGDFDNAIDTTKSALADDPAYASAWDNMGQIYHKMEDIPAAKENFEKAISHKENLVDSLYFLGIIAESEGDDEAAKEYFRRAAVCDISEFNTVSREEVNDKYYKYWDKE